MRVSVCVSVRVSVCVSVRVSLCVCVLGLSVEAADSWLLDKGEGWLLVSVVTLFKRLSMSPSDTHTHTHK